MKYENEKNNNGEENEENIGGQACGIGESWRSEEMSAAAASSIYIHRWRGLAWPCVMAKAAGSQRRGGDG
jgi:hypothetical protein